MREMKYLKVSADIARRAGVIDVRHPVSYTHLTLPTTPYV